MRSTITEENIKCGGCMNSIRTKLNSIDGVTDVAIDEVSGEVTFAHNEEDARAVVNSTLTKMGYPPIGENNLGAKAKSYVSCMVGRMDA